jgi:hypothetical protein
VIRPFMADAFRWKRIDMLKPLLPRAKVTLAQLASPGLICEFPFGAKSTRHRIQGGRPLGCRLVIRTAVLLIVIEPRDRAVSGLMHDMRDLATPRCHHRTKERFEAITILIAMMSNAVLSTSARSSPTGQVSLIASDKIHQGPAPFGSAEHPVTNRW